MVGEGGGGVVMVSPGGAVGIAKPPAWILGTGEAVGYPAGGADLTTTAAIRSGREAFGQAGIRPDEIDVAMIYDSFTITVLAILEDLGFAKKGEGGPFAAGRPPALDRPARPPPPTPRRRASSPPPRPRGL